MAAKQPATETPKAPKKAHRVLQNLRHDGKFHAPGKVVQLTTSDAKSLIALKVVEPVRGSAASSEVEDLGAAISEETATE